MTPTVSGSHAAPADDGRGWGPVLLLAAAQFVMVIDATVMNVSISRIVSDLDTSVVGIQTAITAFTLVMAAFMLTGGKLGDRMGARRAFAVGLIIYGAGSLVTALSPNLTVLLLGWSLLEGLGAVLVIPAIAALIAGTYQGRMRALGYGIIGGVAGAAAAAGPLIGGWVTQNLTWRVVFGVETVMCLAMLFMIRMLPPIASRRDKPLDIVGAVLSALGLGMLVLGILQTSQWGWVTPTERVPVIGGSPLAPLGYSPALWLMVGGAATLVTFARWEQRVVAQGGEPLLDLSLLRIPPLRAGLATLLVQQFVLAGTFFVLPLYLQTMLVLDPFATGLRMLPLSAGVLVLALGGAAVSSRIAPRPLVRAGFVAIVLAEVALQLSIDPELKSIAFGVSLGLLGIGIGTIASQLGNVNLSSVDSSRGGEVGGLQGTAQNLGASLGTALIGAVLLATLANGFTQTVAADPLISEAVSAEAASAASAGLDFVTAGAARSAIESRLPADQAAAVLSAYEAAQLGALKRSVGLVALVALLGFAVVRGIPDTVLTSQSAAQSSA